MSKNPEPAAELVRPWPHQDFLTRATRLRHELEAAVRVEQSIARRVAAIQDASFARGLPATVIAGGKEVLEKMYTEQSCAEADTHRKRDALRTFLKTARNEFFTLREQTHGQLRSQLFERLAAAQTAAAELRGAISELLGAKAEAEREDAMIRAWNREAKKFNRVIPATNSSGIPGAVEIGAGESIRNRIEMMLLEDKNIRELCRDFLSREDARRERAARAEEARIALNEAFSNPAGELDLARKG